MKRKANVLSSLMQMKMAKIQLGADQYEVYDKELLVEKKSMNIDEPIQK